MFRADRALAMNAKGGALMPPVPELRDLYGMDWQPRRGELMMIAGRPGSQKSGFAMWLVEKWGLPTLYLSGDMNAFTASARIASMKTGMTTSEVEKAMTADTGGVGYGRGDVLEAVREASCQFRFGSITYRGIDDSLNAWVEVQNTYPDVLVVDNLMDTEDAEADYQAQMEVMQTLSRIKTELGIYVIVLHHATETTWDEQRPWKPPARKDIKNKLGEKPECTLTVALNPNSSEFNVAVVKQRMGKCDPSGSRYATLRCIPELTRFAALDDDGKLHEIGEKHG